MSLRLLFGMLASTLPEQLNNSEIIDIPEKVLPEEWKLLWKYHTEGEDYRETYDGSFQGAAKFHIGMLTISLIVGLAYGGYVAYTCWNEKDVFLGYIRNLLIALVCRTFFTILFDGVVLLGSSFSVGGANTLSAFEQICLNLVLAFWLSLTVYQHARVQRNFKSEPTLRVYQYGIPAVAVFFAFLWIFTLQDLVPNITWWIIMDPFKSWVVNSINLLFLLIQLGLVCDICRMFMTIKGSLDNDSVSLLWRAAVMLAALVLIFWLQFGLSLGPYKRTQSYLYFFYFIDGIECALVCACFYFFHKWVTLLSNKSCPISGSGETVIPTAELKEAEFLPDDGGIFTVDRVFVSRETTRWKTAEEDDFKDVVYSNVVEPVRLQKTLELYKRFNIIPNPVTVVEGEKFYDCQIPSEGEMETSVRKQDRFGSKNEKMFEPIQKKNAFYASKYLILDSTDGDFPKYLETRPSVSSVSEKDSQKEEQGGRTDFLTCLVAEERVSKWLDDNSENMAKNRKVSIVDRQEISGESPSLTTSKPKTKEEIISSKNKDKDRSVVPVSEDINNNLQSTTHNVLFLEENSPDNQKQIGLDLKPENEVNSPRKDRTSIDAKDVNKTDNTPIEGVHSRPLDDSIVVHTNKHTMPNVTDALEMSQTHNENVTDAPAPTQKNEFEEKEKPKDSSPSPFLTYNELLEFRSKRDKSEEPSVSKQSFSESIFSTLDSLINASGSLLNSLAGFRQEEHDSDDEEFRTYDVPRRQSRDELKSKPELDRKEPEIQKVDEDTATGERRLREEEAKFELKLPNLNAELPHKEAKYQSDVTVPSLPETPTAEQPEYDTIRFGCSTIPTLTVKNLENGTEMRKFADQPPSEPAEDRESLASSDSKFSIEKRDSFSSDGLYKPTPVQFLGTSDAPETQSQKSETSDSEYTREKKSSSTESFSLEQYYTQIMATRSKFENRQSVQLDKKSQ